MNGSTGLDSAKRMKATINASTRMMGVIHHALLCTMKSMNSRASTKRDDYDHLKPEKKPQNYKEMAKYLHKI